MLYNAAAWFAIEQGAKIGIISPELDPDDIFDNLASISSGVPFKEIQMSKEEHPALRNMMPYSDLIHIVSPGENRSEKKLYGWLKYLATIGCQIIIIDALQDILSKREDNELTGIFMRTLQQFTRDSRAHVFLTAHTRKPLESNNKYNVGRFPHENDIKGSSTVATMAFNILGISRNDNKEEIMKDPHSTFEGREEVTGEPGGGIKVLKDKKRGQNKGVKIYYDIEPECCRAIPENENKIIKSWL